MSVASVDSNQNNVNPNDLNSKDSSTNEKVDMRNDSIYKLFSTFLSQISVRCWLSPHILPLMESLWVKSWVKML